MNFFTFLKSLDEFLYELMTWIVFYPLTLWRSVMHPLRTMAYAKDELAKDRPDRFRSTLSPPVFLLVTIFVSHAVELALVGDPQVVRDNQGLSGLISDTSSLIIFRITTFALFPIVLGCIEVGLAHRKLDRDTLEGPFFAQSFVAAPFVLVFGLAGTAARYPDQAIALIATLVLAVSTVAYLRVETLWLARSTGRSKWLGFAWALAGLVICLGVLLMIGIALGSD